MKRSCSKCKQPIIGVFHKFSGALLCESCYPFETVDGKTEFKRGKDGSLTFGRHGYYSDSNKGA